MRTCPGCDYLVPDTWETCFKCGAQLAAPAPAEGPSPSPAPSLSPPAPPTLPPPAWGWTPPTAGGPAAWSPPPMPAGSQPPASRATILLLAGAAVAAVLLIGAVVVLAATHRERHSSSAPVALGAEPQPVTPTTVHVTIPAALARSLSAPGSSAAVIDIHEAAQLVTALIPIRDRALLFGDADTLRELDTGAALAADISNCGCPSTTISAVRGAADGGVASVVPLVPLQAKYPASFFAQVTVFGSSGAKFREFLVLTRHDVRQRWKIAFDTVNEITGPDASDYPGAFDANDFNVLPQKLRVEPAQLMAALAQQWQHQKNVGTGVPGSPFGPDEGAVWAVHRQDSISDNGLHGHFTIRVDPHDPVYEFGLDKGAAFVCGVARIDVVWTQGPQGMPYQDARRENWESTLAPGTYSQIIEHRTMQPCVLLAASPTSSALVLPGDEAFLVARGIKP